MTQFSHMTLAVLLSAGVLAGCSVKPELIGEDEMSSFVSSNAEQLVADQEAVTGSIGLYEAMARALKYNLDHKVEMMNATLAARAADVKSAAAKYLDDTKPWIRPAVTGQLLPAAIVSPEVSDVSR